MIEENIRKKMNLTKINFQMLKYTTFLILLICMVFKLNAKVKPSGVFGDNMVLQRNMEVPIWGEAEKGEKISVTMNEVKINTVADENGKWEVKLPKHRAGGPYIIEITGKSNTVTFKNVLFGEVWFASGQSNMMYTMERGVPNGEEEIASSRNEGIRLFNHPKTLEQYPVKTVGGGSWEVSTPESVKSFSAVAYFFAKELYKKYKVPIGIILSGWGGTRAEAFCSYDVLKTIDEYREEGLKLESGEIDWITDYEPNKVRRIRNKNLIANSNKAIDLGVLNADYDTSSWEKVNMNDWDKSTTNIVWIRNDFNISSVRKGEKMLLELGKPNTRAEVYLNGKFLKKSIGNKIEFRIPSKIFNEGQNSLVIRIADAKLKPGFVPNGNARLAGPKGNTIIDLSKEWKYNDELEPVIKPYVRHSAILGSMFGGMINPFIGYGIKGVIWYQGEANTVIPHLYSEVFSKMIKDWRSKWGQGNFPFLYVQLPNYIDQKAKKGVFSSWPLLREAQLNTLSVPNTGMAITVDIGDPNNLHPENKYPVGLRLSRLARKIAYGEDIVYTGPTLKEYKIKNNKAIIYFNNVGNGLISHNIKNFKGFQVAGESRQFHKAQIEIAGDKIILSSDKVKNIVAIRYNWDDNPQDNIYNSENLPASPFRTDTWESEVKKD